MKFPSDDKYGFKFILNRCDESIDALNDIKQVETDYECELDDAVRLIKLLKNILTPLYEDSECERIRDTD